MRRILTLITVPALALVSLSGCVVVARGPLVSEDRSIGAATSVILDTSGDLTISDGEPSLVIKAPAKVLERLTAEVKDGELVLGVKPGSPQNLNGKITYELSLPSLERIELNGSGDIKSEVSGDDLAVDINGSGDVDINSIAASSVTLNVSGAGDVTFDGRSDELVVSIDGSADVRAEKLDTARVRVDITGTGDVAVTASNRLDVSIVGAGSVTYEGDPKITQEISGVGDISRRG